MFKGMSRRHQNHKNFFKKTIILLFRKIYVQNDVRIYMFSLFFGGESILLDPLYTQISPNAVKHIATC